MTEKDIKSLGLVLSLDECIGLARDVCDNCKDKVKHARTYASKKACKKSIAFYEAVLYHLERLKKKESEIKIDRVYE